MEFIDWDDFLKVDLRSGTVVRAEEFPKARKACCRFGVGLGEELGVRQTGAQVADLYDGESLVGKKVVGVVNLPPKRIAGFESQFLLTGFENPDGAIALTTIDGNVPDGRRLH